MLGSLLKQITGGLERILEEVPRVFERQKMAVGGLPPHLPDILKIPQTVTSSLSAFVGVDDLGEYREMHRVKLLNSLQQIFEKPPNARMLIIRRPHIP